MCKNLAAPSSKIPHHYKWTVKGNSGGSSEGKEDSYQETIISLDNLSNREQNVGSKVNGKGHSDEVLDGNDELVIGNWRKGDP